MKDNWTKSSIVSFADVISGGTPSTNIQEFWDGDVVWITPADLSKIKTAHIHTSSRKISKLGLQSSSANLIPENSIVMSSRAPIGYFAIPSTSFTTNQGCKSFVLKQNQNPSFHFYNFVFNVDRFKAKGEGTTFAEISKKEIEKIEFNLPPLPQQKKIAQILTTCDTVIEKTEATIAKYQAMKQGLMHDLFTRGIDIKTGKLRPKQEDAPELYKESELGWIPMEWKVNKIGDILNIKHGYAFEGRYFSDEKSKYILLTPGNFNIDGSLYFQERNTKYYTGKIPREFIFENNDLLIVMTDLTQNMNILGNVVKLDSENKVLHNQRIGKIETKNKNIIRDYLLFILNSPFSKENIKRTATGTTVKHTSPNYIYNGVIPIPSVEEQKKFVIKINELHRKLQTEQSYLSKYQKLKTGLMQDLLTGKVEVKA